MPAGEDRRLILLCREGAEEGYRELMRRYEKYVYTLCFRLTGNREDALDLTQETFIRAFQHLDRFEPGRPFKPWLRQVAVRLSLNHLRDSRAGTGEKPLSLEYALGEQVVLADTLTSGDDPAAAVEWRDLSARIWEAVGRLPPVYRLVVTLRHQEGMSYQEIAEAADLPVGTVKTYLFRARNRLKAELARLYGWEV
ncbi:RNA polymerase subunit sigma-24 [Kyrpidia spormannii]|uniref:RNA polymerase sigma factor n=2 Tax=Kyrpidia spormannii TaxID=2055160 RepID=A0A2K8N448_9BACL|nr:sigma-70 family RNA polymerase sigma factor [Kyrpidia spormannii]ATY83935.1 RNA polymerase subunit sigma-24 [Kyrpidia spormannii]CAB3389787.1 RNA polymerase sigma factor [Kyrpidia spormannii]CAB3390681.1 RNA polymerase sigma factor [Kyrpidia spormannii]